MRIALLLLAASTLGACATYEPYGEATTAKEYVVQPGDNIHSIAFVLETTPAALQAANRWMQPDRLAAGMRLEVPGRTAAVSTAPAANSSSEYTADAGPLRESGYIWPLRSYKVSSGFGRRWGRLHAGIDLRAPKGTPIRAAADGRVVFAGFRSGYGRMVILSHGQGIETVYAHNSRNIVRQGQRVRRGEIIGNVGRSGNATGYHVHFEFRRNGRPLDPVRQIQASL
ncbi:MAG: LysM peptidoglycan-binding domain-containing M23 family metallopeptidase [Gammaproteobacteria bacterium]|nr:LysM peptidoglycan-binding domain-containing M23 family metallopeptidase [Gammaproteobacteria bacterium]